LAQEKVVAANESFHAANAYWLDYDASNRCAGQAAYWSARGHLANGASQEARAGFTRAIDILRTSAQPDDVRLVADARRTIARL